MNPNRTTTGEKPAVDEGSESPQSDDQRHDPSELSALSPLPNQSPGVGEGTVPTFLAVIFVILPLWAIWYFLTHLAPFLAIQPPQFARDAPPLVQSYRRAEVPRDNATDIALARGAAIYFSRCALCHGADGQGNTSSTLYATARPLLDDPVVQAVSLAQLEEIIADGFPGDMPAWRNELDNAEIAAVAQYVKQVLGSGSSAAAAGPVGPTGVPQVSAALPSASSSATPGSASGGGVRSTPAALGGGG